MPDLHPRAGEFTQLNGAIEIARAKCPDDLADLCAQAREFTERYGPAGLSPEDAARWVLVELSERRLNRAVWWERTMKAHPGDLNTYMQELGKLAPHDNKIRQRAKDELDSEIWRLEHGSSGKQISPDLIAPEALNFAGDTIELDDGNKRSRVRMVRARAQVPTPQESRPDLKVSEPTKKLPRKYYRELKRLEITVEILNTWELCWTKVPPEPVSAKNTVPIVLSRLKGSRYENATPNSIVVIAGLDKYEALRHKPNHKITKAEIADAKRLLAKFRAELAEQLAQLKRDHGLTE